MDLHENSVCNTLARMSTASVNISHWSAIAVVNTNPVLLVWGNTGVWAWMSVIHSVLNFWKLLLPRPEYMALGKQTRRFIIVKKDIIVSVFVKLIYLFLLYCFCYTDIQEVEEEGREMFYLVMRMMNSLPGIPWHLRFKVKFWYFWWFLLKMKQNFLFSRVSTGVLPYVFIFSLNPTAVVEQLKCLKTVLVLELLSSLK